MLMMPFGRGIVPLIVMVPGFLGVIAFAAPSPVSQDKRIPVPEASRLREAEKGVKDVFKAEYARKGPADRIALAKLLLQSVTSQSDPAEQWVCLTQARELAAQAGDWDIAWEAIGTAGRTFECDSVAMKAALLTQAGKAVKTPEEATKVAERHLQLADEAVRQDQLDMAEKSAAAAQQISRKAANAPLAAQAAAKAKEIADVKAGFDRSRKARETLEKNPNDPAANLDYGLFLCLVKGDWEKGVRHLAKGPEGPYPAIAARELAVPEAAPDQAGLGDLWWDQAEKETGPARAGAKSRAAFWYDRAFPRLEGILKTRAEKRMAEVEIALNGSIDLLRLIDPAVDSVATTWRKEGGVLYNGMNYRSRLMVPYQPPDEYDLTVVFATKTDGNPTMIGLVAGGVQCHVFIDGWNKTGIDAIDKKDVPLAQGTNFLHYGTESSFGKDNTVVCSVRKRGIKLVVNGKAAFSWDGPLSKLSIHPEWTVPNPQALYLGAWDRDLAIKKYSLAPVSGQGRRLR
jgi:hypothetical protein